MPHRTNRQRRIDKTDNHRWHLHWRYTLPLQWRILLHRLNKSDQRVQLRPGKLESVSKGLSGRTEYAIFAWSADYRLVVKTCGNKTADETGERVQLVHPANGSAGAV
jgi:hypothetical protein